MYKIETDTLEFKNLEERPVVYFATEYGVTDNLPIYAGGLGILLVILWNRLRSQVFLLLRLVYFIQKVLW